MFKSYATKLVCRILIFCAAALCYLFRPEIFDLIFTTKLYGDIFLFYILWAFLMIGMILQFLPKAPNITMGCRKQSKLNYIPVEGGYDKKDLAEYTKKSNRGAFLVFLTWGTVTLAAGLLYYIGFFGYKELLMTSLLFYVGDLVCVVLFCPFQYFIMKNRCCVTCRIFNWGYFMMFTPLIFIPSFFTWSLVLLSTILILRWELHCYKYPEQFWEGSNAALQCKNCNDEICQIKKPLLQKELLQKRSS